MPALSFSLSFPTSPSSNPPSFFLPPIGRRKRSGVWRRRCRILCIYINLPRKRSGAWKALRCSMCIHINLPRKHSGAWRALP